MKRTRVEFKSQLKTHLENNGGDLEEAHRMYLSDRDYEARRKSLDISDSVPERAALPLGRRGGERLSDVEWGLMQTVQQAFDNGVLNDLSPMQRNCFTDVIISGDGYREVAARYGICVGAVQTHIKRAAKHIRGVIKNSNG